MLFSSNKNSIKASIVDNTLVVSSQSEGNPKALRVDLGKFLSSALEIKEDQENFFLILKPSGMEAEEIGVFPNKKRAAEALQVIVDAMLKGNTMPPSPEKEGSGFIMAFLKFIWFLFLAGLVVISALFIIVSIINKQPLSLDKTAITPTVGTEEQRLVEPPVPTGVPVPAEQALPEN